VQVLEMTFWACNLVNMRFESGLISLWGHFSPQRNLSIYMCFYNTLTMCSKLSVDRIIDMILWWHCNIMFWFNSCLIKSKCVVYNNFFFDHWIRSSDLGPSKVFKFQLKSHQWTLCILVTLVLGYQGKS
jgi:hypothetical protein